MSYPSMVLRSMNNKKMAIIFSTLSTEHPHNFAQ